MTKLYAIGCSSSGPIKIGVSENPKKRMHNFQTANASLLHTFFSIDVGTRELAMELESDIHEVYSEYRTRASGEWFSISSNQAIEAIETAIQTYEHFQTRDDL